MTEWSPFYCLPKAALTPSGLLQLDVSDQEVELIRRSSIELRHDNAVDPMALCPKGCTGPYMNRTTAELVLTVTTHRIVLTEPTNNESRFIHLSNVHVIAGTGGPSFQHPFATYKIVVSTYTYGDLVLVFISSQSNPKENRDSTLQHLEKALSRKQWEMATKRLQQNKPTQTSRRRVGVDHILSNHKKRHERASKLADTALSGDAEQLLQEAGELLQVIQKYTVMLQKYKNKNETSTSSSEDDAEAAQKLAGLLSDMGMTSALTKESFGSGSTTSISDNTPKDEYYEFTARQIADFLLPKFKSLPEYSAGIMSLTDAYCMFNRARGTNLISPEDMKQSCGLLQKLNIGLSQRVFPSGVIVIQINALGLSNDNDNNNDNNSNSMAQTIIKLCPTTALEASHVLKLSPLLAQEQLEEAERLGLLCRDVTLESIRFYPNKFITDKSWTPISTSRG